MRAWPEPSLPRLPDRGPGLRLRNRLTGHLEDVRATDGAAGIYVCGITPYDATHLGHAATYLTFDLAGRVLRDAGVDVVYAQNITDVDDPLLERAERDGIDWRDLAAQEIQLFRDDMTALRVIPPQHYVGVVESMDRHIDVINALLDKGCAYRVAVPEREALTPDASDVYLDLATQPSFGDESGWTREQMMEVFADRGGDPDRVGKRDQLDPLLWRAERANEPAWDGGAIGRGRPGWHVECTTIALDHLGMGFALQGGGTDLIFPHHEMSAVQAVALTCEPTYAHHYAHQAMVAYHGEKMSKSKGNLVKVSQLRRDGEDPMAIRLALLAHHYAEPWEYFDTDLAHARARLDRWRTAVSVAGDEGAEELVAALRHALSNDLDSPAALEAVDAWAASFGTVESGRTPAEASRVRDAIDALLGVQL